MMPSPSSSPSPTTPTATTTMVTANESGAMSSTKRPALAQLTREVRHTRRCNGRQVCSCMLRLESVHFQQNINKKAAHDRQRSSGKGKLVVTKLHQFETDIKALITEFLTPIEIGTLSMVSKQMRKDMELVAERGTKAFIAEPSRKKNLLKIEKTDDFTWSQFMHLQMNCVHKLFVYYTGYKTGAMRTATPHWAFGLVTVDPNNPSATILPNSWKFHEHSPWLKKRGNGKNGEWMLRDTYKPGRAPKKFLLQVRDWTSTLRPGSFLTTAFQQLGATEANWWEAQVWYVWRAGGREDAAVVLDREGQKIHVAPDDLLNHFMENPTHVIDVGSKPGAVCTRCSKQDKSFYFCHMEKGHPML